MGLFNDGFIKKDVSGWDKTVLLQKLTQKLPQYKVSAPSMFGNPVCVEQSATSGLFLYLKKDGIELVQDAPNMVVRIVKAQLGLIGYLLVKLFVKNQGDFKTLFADVQKAVTEL